MYMYMYEFVWCWRKCFFIKAMALWSGALGVYVRAGFQGWVGFAVWCYVLLTLTHTAGFIKFSHAFGVPQRAVGLLKRAEFLTQGRS